jgi:hypothetical protein
MTEKRKEQMRQANRRYRLKKKLAKMLKLEQEEKEHDEKMNEPNKKVAVVMLDDYAKRETSIDSGDSKKINSVCEWCGVLKGLDSNRLCEFCRRFDSKEMMLAEREWLSRERRMRMFPDTDLISKYRREYHSDWKCKCGTVNLWYKKECSKCGEPHYSTKKLSSGDLK